jgi:hypothetical protein
MVGEETQETQETQERGGEERGGEERERRRGRQPQDPGLLLGRQLP